MPPTLVLASASPRRSQLLRDLGVRFTVSPSPAIEPPPTEEDGRNPGAYVEKLALLKAAGDEKGVVRLAADTVVVLNEQILLKPKDEAEARAMLTRLRGQTHRVFTGICLQNDEHSIVGHEITKVTFADFSDEFIASYVATGEPLDKAGSYAAQGKGALLIEKIEGDYFNVVGLPLVRVARALNEFGIRVADFWGA